jgi:hypothetical protein
MVKGDARSSQARSPQVYSPALQPLMQSLLTTLANIDCEHEREIAKAGRSSAQASFKSHLLAKLKQRHRERREPYVQQIAILKQRMHSFSA